MEFRAYHSLDDIYVKQDDFLQNCVPVSNQFELEVTIHKSNNGICKQGRHINASFTCKGDFNGCYALMYIFPDKEEIILNGCKLKKPKLVLTQPGWDYSVKFPICYFCGIGKCLKKLSYKIKFMTFWKN